MWRHQPKLDGCLRRLSLALFLGVAATGLPTALLIKLSELLCLLKTSHLGPQLIYLVQIVTNPVLVLYIETNVRDVCLQNL